MKPYAPLGILYLSSHLRAQGLRCRDLRFHFRFAARSCSGFCETGPPSVLGIGANLMTRGNVLEIAAAAQGRGLDGDRGRTGAGQLRARISGRRRATWWSKAKPRSRWKNCCPRCDRTI